MNAPQNAILLRQGEKILLYTDKDIERCYPEEELGVAAAEGSYEDEGLRVRMDGSTFSANVVITALRDPKGTYAASRR